MTKVSGYPLISVIIPVYNVEKYLRECLDSVINQTLKDIEIICINDGSTDNSPAILQEYKQKDNRITILTQENKGAGAARNAGLDIAKGNYLAILDSDDIYDITMLEKMYTVSETMQTDLTVCFSKAFDNVTKKTWDITWSAMNIEKECFSYKDTLEIPQAFDFFIGWSWDKLFRKSFIDQTKLRFQEISHSNDGFFVFCAMYAASRITILKEYLVAHRANREGSIECSHDKNPLCFYEMYKAVKDGLERIDVFSEVKERYAMWVLRHSMWVLDVIRKPKSFIQIYSMMQSDIFPRNEISKLPFEFFENKYFYDEMKKITGQSPAEYLFDQRNTAREERDYLQGEREHLQAERDHLQIEQDRLQGERDYLHGEQNRLQGERDYLEGERSRLQGERDYLQGEQSRLQAERDHLEGERNNLQAERDHLQNERERLQQEQDRLQQERNELQQERDALLGSLSFRLGRMLTWFPRQLRKIFTRL